MVALVIALAATGAALLFWKVLKAIFITLQSRDGFATKQFVFFLVISLISVASHFYFFYTE